MAALCLVEQDWGVDMANGLDILGPIQQGLQIRALREQQALQRGLAPLQQEQAQLQLQGQREQQRLQSLVTGALELQSIPDEQKIGFLQARRQRLIDQGLPTMDTDEALRFAQTGRFDELNQALGQTVNVGQRLGLVGGGAEPVNLRTFAPVEVTDPQTGERQLVIPSIDPRTGVTTARPVDLPDDTQLARETAAQQRAADLAAAEQKERAKLLAKQRQDIRTEITTNAREARRQVPRVDRLLNALDQVETGKFAQAKSILGPFIPGVDPTNEQALAAQMNDLIFDQLARFTGAISEGERAFAERTVANLGNTTEANRIILNRLKTSFKDILAEDEQFKDFIREGGKAEDFEFEAPEEPTPLFSSALNREITEQEISETLQANPGLTRESLLQQLGVQAPGQGSRFGFEEITEGQ